MTKIIIVRHGQTKWNIGQVFRGRKDIPLNKSGQLQARSLAKALSEFRISAIYSSPLSRAKKTAEEIAKKQNLKIEISDLLLDISYGQWEGLSHEEVSQKWPKIYQLWQQRPHQVKFPQGESLNDVQQRVEQFLKKVVVKHEDETIAVVSHRVAIKVLLCASLKLPLSYFWQFQQNTASYSILEYQDGVFSLVCLNESCHLKEVEGGIDKVDF